MDFKNRFRFFSEYNYRGNHAGTKARNDVETVLRSMNARPINSRVYELTANEDERRISSNIQSRFDLFRLYAEAAMIRKCVILLQYPMLSFDFEYDYYRRLSSRNRLVFLVHDLHSLRGVNGQTLSMEIRKLNLAYAVLVHTGKMKDVLLKAGLSVPHILVMDIFDYLFKEEEHLSFSDKSQQNSGTGDNDYELVFAGNLGKSDFLKDVCKTNPDVVFHLFGSGVTDEILKNRNAVYHGSYKPDIIPSRLYGKYGLVWDGESVDGCSGILGDYLKINAPHKLSLYIAAGIPVIVWDKSATADYVASHHIGICVDSLRNLSEKIRSVSDNDYLHMLEQLSFLRKTVCTGDHLKSILNSAFEIARF